MQDSDADAYVEVPLLFSIQDESLSALHQANLNAKAAHGLVLNTTTADYMVRTCFPLRRSMSRAPAHEIPFGCHEHN